MLPYVSPRQPRHLDRQSAVQWVLDLMRTELLSAHHAHGALPSENQLIARYGVSRGVIRDVLTILRQQGAIDRIRGAGTFALTSGVLEHGVEESRDLAQDVNATGTRVAIRTFHLSVHPAPALTAAKLGVQPGSAVVILEQLSSLDGYPLSVRTSFMRGDVLGALADNADLDLHRSPYELIESIIGTTVGDTDLQISASAADSLLAAWLDVAPGSPLLDTRRVIRSATGEPLEFGVSHARADRLAFNTVMRQRDSVNLRTAESAVSPQ